MKFYLIILVSFVALLFLFSFIQVQKDTKEINCITYYTSLGYTANGCEKIIERFINND